MKEDDPFSSFNSVTLHHEGIDDDEEYYGSGEFDDDLNMGIGGLSTACLKDGMIKMELVKATTISILG